jgi:hypothetical protein
MPTNAVSGKYFTNFGNISEITATCKNILVAAMMNIKVISWGIAIMIAESKNDIADIAIAETSMTGIVLSGIWLNTPNPSPATAPPSIIAANPAVIIRSRVLIKRIKPYWTTTGCLSITARSTANIEIKPSSLSIQQNHRLPAQYIINPCFLPLDSLQSIWIPVK